MSFTAGDLIKDIYAFWLRPAETDLPQSDVITIINRKVNRLLLLMQLSDRNYLAVLSPVFSFNGAERTKSLTFLDELSVVVRVESRSTGSTDEYNWTEEIITDYGAWNDTVDSNVDSVAFFGNSPDGFTMAVNRDATSLEFRLLYETGGVSMANFSDAVPVVQDFFRSTVFYGAAAEAGLQIDNLNAEAEKSRDKKVTYAIAQEAQAIEDFKRWLLNEPGQSVQFRESFNSRRSGAGTARMHAQDGLGGYYSRY